MVDPEGYVDVNVFVYWLCDHPTFGERAHQLVKRIEGAPRGRYVTSTLTIYQTLVTIAGLLGRSLKDQELIEEVVHTITALSGLVIIPLTLRDMIQAVDLMKEYGLDYEDALHLAVALRNKAKEIISNDQDFDRTPLKRGFS